MNPYSLTVYKSPFTKVRVGKEHDGGYVIADIPNVNYSVLIAGGIDTDISFEEQFIKKYSNTKCYAFDGTIPTMPTSSSDITFIKKNISYENNENTTNLHDIIDANESLFIKMDIEGYEIPWIKSLSNEQMNKFEQIVMEFHFPFTLNEKSTFDTMNSQHYLIHFHGNNNCGLINYNGFIMPNVFECTYLHKKYFTSKPDLNTDPIPGDLDMKNVLSKDDIYINYPPFVHQK
jgi:hypothetical protein